MSVICAWLVLLLTFPLFGHDVLEEIEVGASKDLEDFSFTATSVVSPLDLEAGGSSLIGQKLEAIPGVIATQNGGPGGRVSYFFRGTESRHVSFTLDGLKLNDPSSTDRQFDAAFMTASFLREIVVHRGPQAVLYGSDAFGGLIEMRSRQGEEAPQTRLLLRGGSFGTAELALSKDWGQAANRGTITLNKFRTDGISRLNEKRFGATERDGADVTQLTSSSSHQWANRYRTEVLALYLRGQNELDGATLDTSFDESRNHQYVLQQKTHLDLGEAGAVSLRNGFNRHDRFLRTLVMGEEAYAGNLIQHEALYRINTQYFSFLGGLQTEHEDFHITGVERSFDLHSAFAQGALRIENWKFQSGIRGDYHTAYGGFRTGSTGLSYEVGSSAFSLQHSVGFKAPSLYQLYAPPLFGQPIGNAALTPEENDAWELRWSYKTLPLEAEVNLFRNNLQQLITFTNQGFINQRNFTAEGVELSGVVRGDAFELRPSYTHQNFRQADLILRRPRNFGQLGFAFFPAETTELSVRGRFFDSRIDLDENGNVVRLAGFEVLDLGFRWSRGNRSYGVELLNILNREYEELYGFGVMPRSIFFSMGLKLF
jgi:vitamin B12 transporter